MKGSEKAKWIKIKIIAILLIITVTVTSNNSFVNAISFNFGQAKSSSKLSTEELNERENKREADKVTTREILGEDVSKRTLNEKTFLMSDGSKMVTMYSTNIHYEKNGKLEEIDNSLIENNEKIQNREGPYSIEYAKSISKNSEIATIKKENYELKWQIVENEKNTEEDNIENGDSLNDRELMSNSLLENKINTENNIMKNDYEIDKEIGKINKIQAKINNQDKNIEKNSNKLNELYNSRNEKNIEIINQEKVFSKIQYENIIEDTDLVYSNTSESVKESIIIKNKEAINEKYVFKYQTNNLKMSLNENKEILVKDKNTNELIYKIEAPYMFDNKLEQSNAIQVNLKEEGDGYLVEIIPNMEWLEDKEREFPIIIDPTINTSLDYSDIQDTYIFKGDSRTPNRHKAHIIRIGSNNRLKNAPRGLIKFNLPELRAGDQVVAAMLDICNYPDTEEWTPSKNEMQINVHKMTADWQEEWASWDNCNNNYDPHITDYIKYKYDENSPFKYNYFNITSIVKDWYINGNNYGIMLKDNIETYNYNQSDAYFVSANTHSAYMQGRPMIQIVYRNQTGLESNMSYHAQDIGRAGTVNTNDYNGNVTLSHNDVNTPGERLTASISHIYNTNNRNDDSEVGKGFKLNYKQQINLVNINNTEYARFLDEDGTEHYFKKSNNTYLDEDNLNLRLTLENDVFTMVDNLGTSQRFRKINDRWQLYEIEDANKEKITINFDGSGNITSVIDASGATLYLEYNNGKLTAIKDLDGRRTEYFYNGNGNLVQIKYPDGKSSWYEYDYLNLLTKAQNIDNSYFLYDYYRQKVNRVKNIKQYGNNNEEGASLEINYENNTTKFTNEEGYTNVYTFNNSGKNISIGDFGKEGNNVNNAYGKMYEYGNEGTTKNKLLLESNLISVRETPGNLIQNPYFDNGLDNWSKIAYVDGNDCVINVDNNNVYKTWGTAYDERKLFQSVNISGKKGDVYNLSYWVKSLGLQEEGTGGKSVRVTVAINRNDNTTQWFDSFVNTDTPHWQYMSKELIADSDYKSIDIHLINNYGANDTFWDNIGLFKDDKGTSYQYDSNGNIVSTVDKAKQDSTYNYSSNGKIATSLNAKGGKFTYEYDFNDRNRLNKAYNNSGQKYSYKYNNYGNVVESKVEETNKATMLENGKTYNIQFASNNNVFDVRSVETGNGVAIQQWEYVEGYANKEFIAESDKDGYYFLTAKHSNKVIDVDVNKLNIQQYEKHLGDNQLWKAIDNGDGTIRIVSKAKGNDYCITLKEDTAADGTDIILAKWEGKSTQKLRLYDVNGNYPLVDKEIIESGEVYRLKAKNSSLYVEASGDYNSNWSEVTQQEYKANEKRQLWRIVRISDSVYKVVNLASNEGKVLDVTNGINSNNNLLQLYENGENNQAQNWQIYKNSDGTFTIKTKLENGNGCLTIQNASKEVGGKCEIYDITNQESQKFYLEKVDMFDIDAGSTYIIKAKHSNKYIGINGTNVEQQDSNELDTQKWKLKRLTNGYYKILSANDINYAIDIDNMNEEKGTNVKIYNNSSEPNIAQEFEFVPTGDGSYSIRPRLTYGKRCLDVEGASTEDGGNIWSWEINNFDAQKFYLEEVIPSEERKYIKTTGEYSEDGRYLTSMKDQLGNESHFEYDSNRGLTLKEIDAKGNTTNYEYDSKTDNLQKITRQVGEKEYSNAYTYENDNIKTITHNGTQYSYNYDGFGNVKDIYIGNQLMKTTKYGAKNGNIEEIIYGNSQNVKYQYDRFNRVVKKEKITGNIEYVYDSRSNLKTVTDNSIGVTTNYTYDLADRVNSIDYSNNFKINYGYDLNNNINQVKYSYDNSDYTISYNFDGDNNLNSLSFDDTIQTSSYDRLLRITSKNLNNDEGTYKTEFKYVNAEEANRTTTLLESIKNGNEDEIRYTYDELGNITEIYNGNNMMVKYYYDELNQLIRENNKEQNKTITYEYDGGGNLLNKKEYDYTEQEITIQPTKIIEYIYNNANWKDQLTSYDGKEISYDAVGNIISYNGNEYTWQNGRELSTLVNNDKNLNISYKYNDDRIRTEKIVNGIKTEYLLDDNIVILEIQGEDILYYEYDENNELIGFKYNDEQYYYIKNGQNDIIGILNDKLEKVISYEYDTWGNLIKIEDSQGNDVTNDKNSIGYKNPYRYRGYRYDTETGLYYLQSRYYDPEIGRFINADDLLANSGGILEHNTYIYCNNNPINQIDSSGNISIAIVGLVIGIAALVISAFSNKSNTGVVSSIVDGVGSVASSVTSGVKKAVSNANKNQKANYIYVLKDKNERVQYVGRTTDLKKTEWRHKHNKYRENLDLIPIEFNLGRMEARIAEQYYIMYYETLNKQDKKNNQINGLRKSLWFAPEFTQYVKFGLSAFVPENETYVGE